MRKALCTALGAIAMLALVPGAATAATPFTAGTGTEPDVAVGSDGSAHVVWMTSEENVKVGYCRVAPGAESCGFSEKFAFSGATAANQEGPAAVFSPSPNKVVIVAGCWNCPGSGLGGKVFSWTSENNGASFTFDGQIGTTATGVEMDGTGTWIDSAGLFVGAGSRLVTALSVPAVGSSVLIAPAGYSADGEVVHQPGTQRLVAASNNETSIGYRVYEGTLNALSVNSEGNWDPPTTPLTTTGATSRESSLAAGPTGVFLTYKSTAAGTSSLAVRHLDSATGVFAPPAYLQGDNPIDAGLRFPDSAMDSTARLHLVWTASSGGGLLRYRATDTGGSTFTPVGTLASGENFTDPEIGVGNGSGYVTWTQGLTGPIRVVRVDPTYDAPPTTTPVTTPPPGPAPDVTRPKIGKRTLRPGEGTTFRFHSNVAGQAVLTIEKRYAGIKGKRKGKKACLPRTKKRLRALRRKAKSGKAYRRQLKKKRCRAYRRIGEIRQAVKVGQNTIVFNGRVAGRKLGRGSYRAKLVITDAAGRASRTETLKFKVVGKKKKGKKGKRARERSGKKAGRRR